MGKKKKVEIQYNPLQSVTVGKVKTNKYGWIGTILLFGLFFGVVYYLPELNKLYNLYFGEPENNIISPVVNNTSITNNTIVNNNTVVNNTIDNTVVNNVYYELNNTNEITVNNTTISNISLNDLKISFSILGKIKEFNVEDENLFLELYDDNKSLIQRNRLKGSVSPTLNLELSYNVPVIPTYFNIKSIAEEDYDYFTLDIDADKISNLICKKDSQTITYKFDDEKLVFVTESATSLKSESNYIDIYAGYKNFQNIYHSKAGIKVNLGYDEEKCTYYFEADYKKTTEDIESDYYFKKATSPRVVNFIMESEGFECS